MTTEQPEPIEEYVPGVAGSQHYMAKLCHTPDGPWYIEIIHVESRPPVFDHGRTWPTRDAAIQAVNALVAVKAGSASTPAATDSA